VEGTATRVPAVLLGVLARLGYVAKAREYAALTQDAQEQSEAYRLISEVLITDGRLPEARALIKQALQAAEAVEYEAYRAPLLGRAAQILVQMGEKQQATQILNRAVKELSAGDAIVLGRDAHERALSTVSQALVRVGEVDRALTIADTLQQEALKVQVLRDVAQGLIQTGDIRGGLHIAEMVEPKPSTIQPLCAIAHSLVQAGEKAWATKIANWAIEAVQVIEDEVQKVACLSMLVPVLVQLSDNRCANEVANQAMTAAQAIEDKWKQVEALNQIALAFHEIDEQEHAAAIASQAVEIARDLATQEMTASLSITGAVTLARGLGAVAHALVQLGEKELATEIANQAMCVTEKLESEWYKADALNAVAQALAEVGEFNPAVEVAEQIAYQESFAEAVSTVLQTIARAGEIEWAMKVAGDAVLAAEAVEDEEFRIKMLSIIA